MSDRVTIGDATLLQGDCVELMAELEPCIPSSRINNSAARSPIRGNDCCIFEHLFMRLSEAIFPRKSRLAHALSVLADA